MSWKKLCQGNCLSDAIWCRTGRDQIARVVECWQILGKKGSNSIYTLCTSHCSFIPCSPLQSTLASYHGLNIRFSL